MIPPLSPNMSADNNGGYISTAFHRWLQSLIRAASAPFTGDNAPGRFVVGDGEFGIMAKRLTLAGSDRATVSGTGRLVICG